MGILQMNRIKPAPDPHKKSELAPIIRSIYGEKGDEFLHHLRQFGHVTYAANMTGITRRTFYDRRDRNPEFAEAWDEALAGFEEELTHRVVQTALEMGTGKWVPVIDPKTGEPELDDDFEVVQKFVTTLVEPRILNKLLSLRMQSADGPAQTNVQINNTSAPKSTTGSMPKLVRPTVAEDVIDAEVIAEEDEG